MRFVCLAICFLLVGSVGLYADQNDPVLDELFETLQKDGDSDSGLEITREIWNRWHHTDDEAAKTLLGNGVALMSVGALVEALGLFDRVVHLSPGFAEGWNKRATVLYLLDRNDESISDIKRTLELEPRHFGALSGLGLILLESGRYQAALTAFEKARDINPHTPGVIENIERTRRLLRNHSI